MKREKIRSLCVFFSRILHCHVNPANMREFGRSFTRSVIDAVVAQKTYTYWIDHTDNAQLMDLFTFGVFGGIYLGDNTYGQLTNFNLDCVTHRSEKEWYCAEKPQLADCTGQYYCQLWGVSEGYPSFGSRGYGACLFY